MTIRVELGLLFLEQRASIYFPRSGGFFGP